MGAKYTKAQALASKRYLEDFDDIRFRVPKGKKEEYMKMAEEDGKSLNKFIIDCIEQIATQKRISQY